MKKVIVIAIMMSLLSGLVYSQNITFSGLINSGLGVAFNDVDDSDPVLAARANDAEQNGYRFRLNGQYTNEAKTAGARFRFQMQGGGVDPTISHVWGWMNFFDGILQLNGGRIEESTWTTGDFWLASDSVSWFAGDGALLKIMPIDGLVLGAGAYVSSRDSSNFQLNLEDARYTVHAGYTMPDVFRFDFSFRTESDKSRDPDTNSTIFTGQGRTSSAIFADVRLLMIPNLTAVIATQFDKLEDFSDAGLMIFSETFGYKINDELNVGLNAVQWISNVEANEDISMLFNPWVSYAIGKIVPRLDLFYVMGGNSAYGGGSLNNAWYRHSFSPTYNGDDSVLNIRPSITINVDSRIRLEIGDSIYFDSKKAGDVMTNVFYIDMVWNF